ncbi:hypothetical protein OM076_22910 [Solirubrobacter ginsenosidimutans]|uniref:Uncharacterized protein n=1 Tax=Solirubrobacter ginsenosidimutans TaxID=490573 RepID=A0A9X3MXE5_9ACTN|nr:hypothetical protein [Solirubrobacter ginsenosidimutans]MDA0163143.1 hypothetical protein [Solirubrobacter ginsenosidimutans]
MLRSADLTESPWKQGSYIPELDLLRDLLKLTLGSAQRSGRIAKGLDAWIAHELRRAGFLHDAVWPRTRRPRILPADLADIEAAIDELVAAMEDAEATGPRLTPARVRRAIRNLNDKRLGEKDAYILGDFYAKQVDVVISSWRRGPELLVSTKTMFSSYRNNFKNRHEEAVGEVSTLRRRHPMAAMGFVFLVRSNIYDNEGDYGLLQNILTRLRRPGETFDATMLLVAEWDEADPAGTVRPVDQPDPSLDAGTFFADLVKATTERTPAGEHAEVRRRREGEPKGGLPDITAAEIEDIDADD